MRADVDWVEASALSESSSLLVFRRSAAVKISDVGGGWVDGRGIMSEDSVSECDFPSRCESVAQRCDLTCVWWDVSGGVGEQEIYSTTYRGGKAQSRSEERIGGRRRLLAVAASEEVAWWYHGRGPATPRL